jgi:1-pyrroline-5-carboxylate dehydrogenase
VAPTVIVTTDPHTLTMENEIFGPVLTVYVYDDDDVDGVMDTIDATSPYALTGSIFANDRAFIEKAGARLRHCRYVVRVSALVTFICALFRVIP